MLFPPLFPKLQRIAIIRANFGLHPICNGWCKIIINDLHTHATENEFCFCDTHSTHSVFRLCLYCSYQKIKSSEIQNQRGGKSSFVVDGQMGIFPLHWSKGNSLQITWGKQTKRNFYSIMLWSKNIRNSILFVFLLFHFYLDKGLLTLHWTINRD